tara:strand:- start:27072 stop:28601 length:1530 start_codon:yes stop_codon:yes gene_type:complete
MPKINDATAYNKRKVIIRVVLGYFFALVVTLSVVSLALTRLNKINSTVEELTNRLAETLSLSQDVIGEVQLAHFHEDHYRHFYQQNDLDLFNEKLLDLKKHQAEIGALVNKASLHNMVAVMQEVTEKYEKEFQVSSNLIVFQQSLLSTLFIKQELLVENQLSAIRINVGNIQVPDIFFAFGNARNAFELMRLYQSKYLSGHDEKYFVMFKNNYNYASQAFSDLSNALNSIERNNYIALNADKAKAELKIYFQTFVDIHTANIELIASSRKLHSYQLQISDIGSKISAEIEYEYKKHNEFTQQLVQQTKIELLVTIFIAILLNLLLIFIVLQKIISPIFHDMRNLSNLDGLTGIANRRRFDTCLQNENQRTKREQQALSLIMCDVDYFKGYNDIYGHQMGDTCLQKIATTIENTCKRPGDLVARYGGEEFAIILPNTISGTAMQVAKNIKSNIEALKIPHNTSSVSPFITISMGITTIIGEDISVETLILRADTALYRAKKNGRNCIVSD